MSTPSDCGGLVGTAKPVVQEISERNLLLADEARLRELSLHHQVYSGADAARGGDLDRSHGLAGPALRIHLPGEGHLRALPIAQPRSRHEYDHDILLGVGDGRL